MKLLSKIIICTILLNLNLFGVNIDKTEFIIKYDTNVKGPTKVSYILDNKSNLVNIKERPSFYKEPLLTYDVGVVPNDLTNTGFDRGHIAADATFDYDLEVLKKTYSMANIVPQYPNVNRKVWANIEELERYNVSQFGSLYVENFILYGNETLKKLPLEEILLEKKFKDKKHENNYIKKYIKDSENLEKKEIYVPTFFIKKMFNEKYNFSECFKVPNLKDLDLNIDKYKIDCNSSL